MSAPNVHADREEGDRRAAASTRRLGERIERTLPRRGRCATGRLVSHRAPNTLDWIVLALNRRRQGDAGLQHPELYARTRAAAPDIFDHRHYQHSSLPAARRWTRIWSRWWSSPTLPGLPAHLEELPGGRRRRAARTYTRPIDLAPPTSSTSGTGRPKGITMRYQSNTTMIDELSPDCGVTFSWSSEPITTAEDAEQGIIAWHR
ncbi:hypothetical protein [Streptomyces sp. NBC_01481]|uniref:hypothetical protein n=1 Tax=Streptomyces sp. NBC_01481 TaxID=2975869 RepID=UPI00224EB135|nr:hypothetical protein [Streptomyces sp. NBC_01481]MCX4588053.1 hypothetical protein [Streptomyces sp. NBC_01481]